MNIKRMIEDGSFVPDPDTYPDDLVFVKDVYGHRHRVRQKHLDNGRTMLPLFNQYGVHIMAAKHGFSALLHKDNIQQ
jgi:hypothetical protein